MTEVQRVSDRVYCSGMKSDEVIDSRCPTGHQQWSSFSAVSFPSPDSSALYSAEVHFGEGFSSKKEAELSSWVCCVPHLFSAGVRWSLYLCFWPPAIAAHCVVDHTQVGTGASPLQFSSGRPCVVHSHARLAQGCPGDI